MANFLLVLDPDAIRRKAAAEKAHGRVAFLPRLKPELVLASHYAITWAAAPHAPISRSVAEQDGGVDCVLFGEPHVDSGRLINAHALRNAHEMNWHERNRLNGFYCALILHPRHGARVEVDVLGMFPLYFWQNNEVTLIGTSPGLFRCHPSFQPSVDLHGVAGLLLTSGIVGGRTLLRGVRRLPADHTLLAAPGTRVREVAPASAAIGPTVSNLDDAVEQASALHLSFLKTALSASREPGIQLSGGLDSRLLAGFTTSLKHRPTCLTFGRSGDLDARCARQVAAELDLSPTLSDVEPADYATYASSSVEWEQLSGGLYALPMGWNIAASPPETPMDRMVCGLTLDAVIGGPKNVADTTQDLSFERLRVGRLGFDRQQLASLVAAPELLSACDDVRAELLEHYRVAGPTDYLREWRMNLEHRHRFAVGACAWRYALFAWPVMPALDRRLIELAQRLPYAVVKDRQLQTRMLISRYPQLARLELDRNYLDTKPLIGTKRSFMYDIRRRMVKLSRRCRAGLGHDPRFYVRTMEINSPGWRVVRSLADEARPAAHTLFHQEELSRILPKSPEKVRNIQDPIIHSTPLKNTLGLMLWMRQQARCAV